nr:hypothetical protein [Tanacetum cinerariifolium]
MEILLEPTSSKLLVDDAKYEHGGQDDAKYEHGGQDKDLPLRCQVYQGRLLVSFQDDAKYEHGGQDIRSQGGKDDQD